MMEHEGTTSSDDTPGRSPAFARAPEVDVVDPGGRLPAADAGELGRLATLALRELGARGELRLRIVDDAEMAAAHERHLGDPTTTDVLTFDLSEAGEGARAEGGGLDADLLLCVDEAARQAAARGVPPVHELLLYAVHGVLHCLGYDDHDEDAAGVMHQKEDDVLTAIGVGPVFAPAGGGTATGPTPAAQEQAGEAPRSRSRPGWRESRGKPTDG